MSSKNENYSKRQSVLENIRAAEDSECYVTALSLIDSAMQLPGEQSTNTLMLAKAENLRLIGRYKDAIEVLRLLCDRPNGDSWLTSLQEGQIYTDQGNLEGAINCFKKAIQQNPNSTIGYVYLANALRLQERNLEAVRVLLSGAEIAGDPEEIHLNLALSYRALERYTEAIDALRKALLLNPDYEDARVVLRDLLESGV